MVRVMSEKTVTRDWDVIVAITADKINNLWQQKYDRPGSGMPTVVEIDKTTPLLTPGATREIVMRLTVGPPLLTFNLLESNKATLTMDVLEVTGHITYRFPEYEAPPTELNESPEGKSITAVMAIVNITGNVTANGDHKDIVLDMSSGVFQTTVSLSGVYKHEFSAEIKEYFTQHLPKSTYLLGTVVFTRNTPPSLTPTEFYFKSVAANGYDVLYIFIRTDSIDASATANSVRSFGINDLDMATNNVLPRAKEAALFISSRVLFKDLIQPQLSQDFNGGTFTASKITSATTSAYQITGSGTTNVGNARFCENWFYSSDRGHLSPSCQSKPINIPLNQFKIKPKGQNLDVTWSADFSQPIWHTRKRCDTCGWRAPYSCNCRYWWEEDNINVQMSLDHDINLSVDDNQIVSFSLTGANALVDSANFDWARLGDYTRQSVVNGVRTPRISIEDVSVFAVSNIIFPEAKVLEFHEAYVPGDIVIVGNVTRTYNPV